MVDDKTIEAEGLGKLFTNLRRNSARMAKKLAESLMKNRGGEYWK